LYGLSKGSGCLISAFGLRQGCKVLYAKNAKSYNQYQKFCALCFFFVSLREKKLEVCKNIFFILQKIFVILQK